MKKIDKKIQIKIIKIILIIIWMIIIFNFSAQNGDESGNASGKFTEMVIKIITGKNFSTNEPFIQLLESIIRKLAHYTIYTIGGFLIINYIDTIDKTYKKKILYSITFGGLYAITDEIHQFFVPGRSARILDVCIDTSGVITGVLIYIFIKMIIEYIKNKNKN